MKAEEIAQAASLINGAYAKGVKNVRIAAQVGECTERYLKENFNEENVEEDEFYYYARIGSVSFVSRKEKINGNESMQGGMKK